MPKQETEQLSARDIALKELTTEHIDPNSREGQDFLLRTVAFGIMGVQPPREPEVVAPNGGIGSREC